MTYSVTTSAELALPPNPSRRHWLISNTSGGTIYWSHSSTLAAGAGAPIADGESLGLTSPGNAGQGVFLVGDAPGDVNIEQA